MIKSKWSDSRGFIDSGWLQSYHSFSFGSYYDPENMNFSVLRVINDDKIAGGAGFEKHRHENMEIISYVLAGKVRHQDSLGNETEISAGEVQRITAGTGIEHSEKNADSEDPAYMLQIWLHPSKLNLQPAYEQQHFSVADKLNKWCLIASPSGRNGSLSVNQDVNLYASILNKGHVLRCEISVERSAYLYVAKGQVFVEEQKLETGDALMVTEEQFLRMVAFDDSELLWFDLP